MIKPNSQNARILRVLGDGRWKTVATIHRKAGTCRLNSRISELRKKHGYVIEHEKLPGQTGTSAHRYRLITPVTQRELEDLITEEHLPRALDRESVPRDAENRYRIYRMVYDELELVATAPTPETLGREIVVHGEWGAFDRSCIGVLDTHGSDDVPGSWVVHPWDTTP